MAAPSPTARQTPTGIKLRDGYRTLFTFVNLPAINLWEMDGTKPMGVDGGDLINVTTFHNVAVRTKAPRALYEVTAAEMTCAYDAGVYTDIISQINKNQVITQTVNDGTTVAAWGVLRKFEPSGNKDGDMPTATVAIEFTNVDASYAEQVPVVTSVAGT